MIWGGIRWKNNMRWFETLALLITISACFSFINYKFFKFPKTVGLMLISLIFALTLAGLQALGIPLTTKIVSAIKSIDFSETVLQGILCFLLFAGALHIDLNDFLKQKWSIGILASFGVLLSAFIIAAGVYFLFPFFGFQISFVVCFLFGALISPTDPIATLAILRNARISQSIKMKIAGESLFNDGMGVVLFMVALSLMQRATSLSITDVVVIFMLETVGGIAYGLVIGYAAYQLIKRVDDYHVEILLSIALVSGGYVLASVIHVSGPLAIVVAGLFIGNHAKKFGMSPTTCKNLDIFWNVTDDLLNVILFVLVGLEALLVNVEYQYAFAGLSIIPLVLFARFASVSTIALWLKPISPLSKNAVTLLTWGGLRGGISFALVLTLPQGMERDALVLITYMIVVFSVLCQGMTMRPLLARIEQREVAKS